MLQYGITGRKGKNLHIQLSHRVEEVCGSDMVLPPALGTGQAAVLNPKDIRYPVLAT